MTSDSTKAGVSIPDREATGELEAYQAPSVKDLGSFVDLTLAKGQHGADKVSNSSG